MNSRRDVYAAIDSERDYQDMRKTRDQGQEFHSTEEFLLYMEHYMHLARETASTTWGPTAKAKTLEIIRKVTALGVACMEVNGAPQREGHPRIAIEGPTSYLGVIQNGAIVRKDELLQPGV